MAKGDAGREGARAGVETRRVWQHRQKTLGGFTAKYNVTRLVYFEEAAHPQVAIAREKQLKGWRRSRKIELISAANPTWRDLAEDEGFSLHSGDSSARDPRCSV